MMPPSVSIRPRAIPTLVSQLTPVVIGDAGPLQLFPHASGAAAPAFLTSPVPKPVRPSASAFLHGTRVLHPGEAGKSLPVSPRLSRAVDAREHIFPFCV